MSNDEEEPTIDQLIGKYRELRVAVEVIENQAKEQIAQYKQAMEYIENHLGALMTEWKVKSLPTAFGTAYRTTVTNIKIDEKETFVDWAYENHRELLQVSCNKTAIKEYEPKLNSKGEIITPGKRYPPGITVTKLNKVNVRG